MLDYVELHNRALAGTGAAVVGLTCPNLLADGAATGTPLLQQASARTRPYLHGHGHEHELHGVHGLSSAQADA